MYCYHLVIIKKCFPYLKASYLNLPYYMFAYSCFKSLRHCRLLFVLSYHLHLLAHLFFAVPGCWWSLVVFYPKFMSSMVYTFLWCCMPSTKLCFTYLYIFRLVFMPTSHASHSCLPGCLSSNSPARKVRPHPRGTVWLTWAAHSPSASSTRQGCTKMTGYVFIRKKSLAKFSVENKNFTFY